jgi:phosphatidylinositol glycan class H protein
MCDVTEEPRKIVDGHHIIVKGSNALVLFVCITILTLLTLALHHYSGIVRTSFFWRILVGARFVYSVYQKQVVKESVVIIPAFGIQLETRYRGGRVVHNFVPVDEILKPVLNEHVTPFTCYWSLGLVVRGKEELVLAFKQVRPPVKMLAPIWKALCAATTTEETTADNHQASKAHHVHTQ